MSPGRSTEQDVTARRTAVHYAEHFRAHRAPRDSSLVCVQPGFAGTELVWTHFSYLKKEECWWVPSAQGGLGFDPEEFGSREGLSFPRGHVCS